MTFELTQLMGITAADFFGTMIFFFLILKKIPILFSNSLRDSKLSYSAATRVIRIQLNNKILCNQLYFICTFESQTVYHHAQRKKKKALQKLPQVN